MRIVIFGSGRGSNYKAIVEKVCTKLVQVSAVISDKSEAGIVRLAEQFGHRSIIVESKDISREEHETKILIQLKNLDFDIIVLAGYMRILSPYFLREVKRPIINIHPSLLPSFPGMNAQEQALEKRVKYSGCTVHKVSEQVDGGEIIDQEIVEVYGDDDVNTLSQRILEKEHILYPRVIEQIAKGEIEL